MSKKRSRSYVPPSAVSGRSPYMTMISVAIMGFILVFLIFGSGSIADLLTDGFEDLTDTPVDGFW